MARAESPVISSVDTAFGALVDATRIVGSATKAFAKETEPAQWYIKHKVGSAVRKKTLEVAAGFRPRAKPIIIFKHTTI